MMASAFCSQTAFARSVVFANDKVLANQTEGANVQMLNGHEAKPARDATLMSSFICCTRGVRSCYSSPKIETAIPDDEACHPCDLATSPSLNRRI